MSYKRYEDEESPKEELGPEAHAESAEQTDIVLGDLKKVLEKWEEGEYDSDDDRWQEYAEDIQNFIDEFGAGEEEPEEHTEEECEEVHPDQAHEEWEAEQEGGEEEEPSPPKKESKSKKKKESKKSSKSSSKNFPYESKQLEQMIYKELITALSGN